MQRNVKDIVVRAIKTFVQASISCVGAAFLGVNYAINDQTGQWWIALVLSAVAAGVSAVWNALIKPIYIEPPTE
jgi:hypothetical protein